ncbi:MAG: glycosyltransferase family 39 protein [Pseudomonadota bacterium]
MWNPTVRESLYLVVLAALCFTLQLGSAPLFDGDEGRAAVSSWSMWATGDYLAPRAEGQVLMHQPPLFVWIQALSSALFGLDEPAFRLPSSLAASVWMLVLYAFCRTRMGVSSARAVAMFMAASLAVSIVGRSATPHALMNLWVTLALLDAYRWTERARPALVYRVYLWMGLGVLTQGLAAVLIPLVASSAYLMAGRRFREARAFATHPTAWLLLLVLTAPWFVVMGLQHGSAFWHGFFVDQWGGLLPEGTSPTTSSPIEFLSTLPLVVVPFSVLAMVALWRAGQSWQNPLHRFSLMWLGTVLVVFSIPGAELPHQLLLGSSPLFILMARFRETLRNRWLLLAPLVGFAAVAAVWPIVQRYRELDPLDPFRNQTIAYAIDTFSSPFYVVGALLFLALSLALCAARRLHSSEALLAAGFLQAWFVGLCLLPTIADSRQLPVKEAGRLAAERQLEVVTWATRSPSFSVYRGTLTPHRVPRAGEWVFTREGRLPLVGAEIAYRRGGYILMRPADAVLPQPGTQSPADVSADP